MAYNKVKVALVSTHPIQYQIPWFQHLALQDGIKLKVYYALIPGPEEQGIGFDVPFKWNIPMLVGYDWKLLPNLIKKPGLNGFFSNSVQNIVKIFKIKRPDIGIITGWHSMSMLQSLWAFRRLAIPCLVRGDSNALKSRSALAKQAHRILLSSYDGFLSVGNSNREFYLQNKIRNEQIFNCPHFVDNSRFSQQAKTLQRERASIRSSWGIHKHAICFVYAGKLVPKKRIFDLLHALQQASKHKNNIYLLVAGAGELMDSAQHFANSNGLAVRFTGFLNQMEIAGAYVAGDCLVLPSDYGETWGLVVNEAMACGLPAIVSDRVGCGPDLVDEGVTGSIFPFGDVDALAQKMLYMASDPQKIREMGQRAKELVFQNYSVEKAVEGTLKAIEATIGRV